MSIGGLSKTRLGRMHDVMAGYVERGEVHVDAIGTRAVASGGPILRDTIFRIASLTKPIAAAATMILVDECKLRLDEPVDRLLPELANRKVLRRLDGKLDDTVPANRPITVRDLLTFRAGYGIVMAPPDTYPIQTAMSEQLLGQGPPKPQTPPAPDEWIRRLGRRGLVSTIDDYLAFGQMLLNKGKHGGERILSRPSIETMTTDQLTPEQKAASGLIPGYFDGHGWGFGVSVITRRDDVAGSVGTFGWDGGLGTSWRSDPKEDMVGILMTQRAWTSPNPPDVCLDFWTSVYQAIDD